MNPGILLYKPRMHSHSAAELVPGHVHSDSINSQTCPESAKYELDLPLVRIAPWQKLPHKV
jgi:hypothetical protein